MTNLECWGECQVFNSSALPHLYYLLQAFQSIMHIICCLFSSWVRTEVGCSISNKNGWCLSCIYYIPNLPENHLTAFSQAVIMLFEEHLTLSTPRTLICRAKPCQVLLPEIFIGPGRNRVWCCRNRWQFTSKVHSWHRLVMRCWLHHILCRRVRVSKTFNTCHTPEEYNFRKRL